LTYHSSNKSQSLTCSFLPCDH